VAAFDNDKKKIGKKIGEIEIFDIKKIKELNIKLKCEIAILTIPSYIVHEVHAAIAKTDIPSILNFTPIILTSNDNLLVRNMDFVSELKIISYLLKVKKDADKN
ncbi:redox-sensing transcriptional repressor Rex, partial [candidate division WOR-3 bacterium]|nr:redox-sensing transcriptional repressor Rex [candidate division WOR-3 bacterium]